MIMEAFGPPQRPQGRHGASTRTMANQRIYTTIPCQTTNGCPGCLDVQYVPFKCQETGANKHPDDPLGCVILFVCNECKAEGGRATLPVQIPPIRDDVRAELKNALEEYDGCEINPSNYRHDDVCHLNDNYVGLFQAVERAIGKDK